MTENPIPSALSSPQGPLPISYRVFVSHSAADRAAVSHIMMACHGVGVEPYIFEHDQRPGQSVAEKIQRQIIECDAVVVLLTKESADSAYVQQEIGFALAHGKPVLPLVEDGVSERTLAMLKGVEWVTFDPSKPDDALGAMAGEVTRLHSDKRLLINCQQKRQDLYFVLGLVALLIIGGYLLTRTSG